MRWSRSTHLSRGTKVGPTAAEHTGLAAASAPTRSNHMKIDNAILNDLLALADEIRQAERLTVRQALKRAMRE